MKKLLAALLALAITVCAVILAVNWYSDNRLSNISANASLFVYPGDSVSTVYESLVSQGVVINPGRLERVLHSKQLEHGIKPGHYYVNKGNPSIYVARMLSNGWQSPVMLTLAGTMRRPSDIARRISRQMLVDSAAVMSAMQDRKFLDSLGFSPATVLSLFIPDSYEFYWTDGASEILEKFKRYNDAFWTAENISKASALHLSPQQVSTLASIVTAESNYTPEQPKIAGVYLNRLALGMPLQADPTIAFCFDYVPERILTRHLQVDSPYNTYKHKGLPPGPICVPTRESLEAVLNPDFGSKAVSAGARGCNLYFCANPDFSGTHVFATDLPTHNANARAFQAEMTRRHRAKKAASR